MQCFLNSFAGVISRQYRYTGNSANIPVGYNDNNKVILVLNITILIGIIL